MDVPLRYVTISFAEAEATDATSRSVVFDTLPTSLSITLVCVHGNATDCSLDSAAVASVSSGRSKLFPSTQPNASNA